MTDQPPNELAPTRLINAETGEMIQVIYAVPQANQSGAEGSTIELAEIGNRILKQWRIVTAATILFALASLAYVFSQANVYTASVTAMVPQERSGGALLSQAAGLAAIAGVNLPAAPTSNSDTIMALLGSRRLQNALISTFELSAIYGKSSGKDDLLLYFRKDWAASIDKKTNTITFGYTARDPTLAANVANQASVVLGQLFTEVQQGEATRERIFLEGRLAQALVEQQQVLDRLAEFQRANNAIEIQSQTQATVEALGVLQGRMISQQIELRAMRTVTAGDDSPQVRLLAEQVRGMEKEIERLLSTDRDGALIGLGAIPALTQLYLAKVRDAKRSEALTSGLMAQLEGSRMSEAREGRAVTIVDAAAVPDKKSGPMRAQTCLGATLTGLIAGMVLALANDRRRRNLAAKEAI